MNADTDTHTHIYALPHTFTFVIYRHLSIQKPRKNVTKFQILITLLRKKKKKEK